MISPVNSISAINTLQKSNNIQITKILASLEKAKKSVSKSLFLSNNDVKIRNIEVIINYLNDSDTPVLEDPSYESIKDILSFIRDNKAYINQNNQEQLTILNEHIQEYLGIHRSSIYRFFSTTKATSSLKAYQKEFCRDDSDIENKTQVDNQSIVKEGLFINSNSNQLAEKCLTDYIKDNNNLDNNELKLVFQYINQEDFNVNLAKKVFNKFTRNLEKTYIKGSGNDINVLDENTYLSQWTPSEHQSDQIVKNEVIKYNHELFEIFFIKIIEQDLKIASKVPNDNLEHLKGIVDFFLGNVKKISVTNYPDIVPNILEVCKILEVDKVYKQKYIKIKGFTLQKKR